MAKIQKMTPEQRARYAENIRRLREIAERLGRPKRPDKSRKQN
jgi:hypothetical protein